MSVVLLKEIFLKSVQSVQPEHLIKKWVKCTNWQLEIGKDKYSLRKPCYIVGFGKAVLGMAQQLENILNGHLAKGIVSVPKGIFNVFPSYMEEPSFKIEYIEGATYNMPDEDAMNAAIKIHHLAKHLKEDDLLIVLISGGGSALLPLPKPPLLLADKFHLINSLSKRGADIRELNCVRKRLSLLKGGGLAKVAAPASIVSLILSDVINNPLDVIASGPTVPNPDKSQDALNIVSKYMQQFEVNDVIKTLLQQSNDHSATFNNVKHYLIGNNEIAAICARNHAIHNNLQSCILSISIMGDVTDISDKYVQLVRNYINCKNDNVKLSQLIDMELYEDPIVDTRKSICFVGSGEPTVNVKGTGLGGRNQQLALDFSIRLHKLRESVKTENILLLSAGTDGIDGPTDAAGAIGSLNLVADGLKQNANAIEYLENNDSNSFFTLYGGGKALIKVGHTGTNVMDLHLLLIVKN